MGKLINGPQTLKVHLHPMEIIHQPFYLPGVNGGKPVYTGSTIGDAILRAAWRMVSLHAPQLGERPFKYGDVVWDEAAKSFVVTYFAEVPKVSSPPGLPTEE
jgi:hypothetical protein